MDPFSYGLDLLNTGLSIWNGYQNKDFAREQATTAFDRQVSLMNMQNSYNTPANQMKRFVDAGLNPNLAYGQLQNGLMAPSVPQGSAQNQLSPQVLLQNSYAMKQMQNLDTQNDLAQQKLNQDIQESLTRMGVNDANAQYLAGLSSTIPVSIFHMEQQISLLSKQERSLSYDVAVKSLTQSDVVQRVRADLGIAQIQAEWLGKYYAATVAGLKATARRDLSQASLNSKNEEVARAVARLYDAQAYGSESYNRTYYDTGFKFSGETHTAANWDILQGITRNYYSNAYQAKTAELINKFGDAESVMSLIRMGAQSLSDVASAASNFGLTRRKSSVRSSIGF